MAELKTKPNNLDVIEFINSIVDDSRKNDSLTILKLMQEATGSKPKMWGEAIVGFGTYHYKYASGREGDWFLTGFSPRKQALTLYLMNGFTRYDELMNQLGKHKTGKSCLYIQRLEDVNMEILTELIQESVLYLKKEYPLK